MLNNLLLQGGKVLVVGGMNRSWEAYRKYDQLEFWTGDQSEIRRVIRSRQIPANCKAVVISRYISHSELNQVLSAARKRGIVLFPNKNDGEVANILEEMTAHLRQGAVMTVTPNPVNSVDTRQTPAPVATPVPTHTGGVQKKLDAFDIFIDWKMNNRQNAQALIQRAAQLGVSTTENSLANYVGNLRRKINAPASPAWQRGAGAHKHKRRATRTVDTPAQSKTLNSLDVSVQFLDNVIKDLQGVRDYLVDVTEENAVLKQKVAKFKRLFEDM